MDPKFLESLVEEIFLHHQGFAERLLRLGFCMKFCKHSIQQRNIRVISIEEKVVGMTVSI